MALLEISSRDYSPIGHRWPNPITHRRWLYDKESSHALAYMRFSDWSLLSPIQTSQVPQPTFCFTNTNKSGTPTRFWLHQYKLVRYPSLLLASPIQSSQVPQPTFGFSIAEKPEWQRKLNLFDFGSLLFRTWTTYLQEDGSSHFWLWAYQCQKQVVVYKLHNREVGWWPESQSHDRCSTVYTVHTMYTV